jgi:PleD family two-component response regulator
MEGRKILTAVSTPELHGLLQGILAEHKLVFVTNLEQAQQQIDSTFDLIISGLHFDNGRMYELLQYAKSAHTTKAIPFLCIQMTGGMLSYGTFRSMATAFYLLGGNLFIQVAKWRIEFGDEMAFEKLRDVVQSLITKPQVISTAKMDFKKNLSFHDFKLT